MGGQPPEYPIKVGSMLYTLVDPNPGHEVAYNRWYERDHFYGGCMVGPWLFAGNRFVSTRELKDLRFGNDEVFNPIDAGSYVAIYWVHEGKHDEHFGWAIDQVQDLYRDGRGFADRTHAHTILCDYVGTVYRDDDPVPVELALDHNFPGMVSVFIDRADGATESEIQAIAEEALAGTPAAMSAAWRSHIVEGGDVTANAPMDLGTPAGGPERLIQLFFLDEAPQDSMQMFRDYADRISSEGLGEVQMVSPFITTIVGTDTYTDQLW